MIKPSRFFRPAFGLSMGHVMSATLGAGNFVMLRQATAW